MKTFKLSHNIMPIYILWADYWTDMGGDVFTHIYHIILCKHVELGLVMMSVENRIPYNLL